MPHSDKLNDLFQSALVTCLLFSCAAINAQETNSQEDGKIRNPKECVQTEIVWTEERISDANSLISDYLFSYPEGIKVTNRCDKDVSGNFGVDAVLQGTFGMTGNARILDCEGFTIFSGAKTNFMKFPESVSDAAKRYHYKKARRLASGRETDIWTNLYWEIDYRGCIEWCDEAMKIETGYWHRCKDVHFYPVCPISPGRIDKWDNDFDLSVEVVQDDGGEQQATHEKSPEQTALERQPAGEMVFIPAGTFRMGDLSGEGYVAEQPVRIVTVPAFRLGKYEVTFPQWDACVADGGCNGYTPFDEIGCGRDSRPVKDVSWNDVQSFIYWLNQKTGGKFRLPTEAGMGVCGAGRHDHELRLGE